MATNPAGLTIIDTLVKDLQGTETVKNKKANTITTAVGSVATIAAAALSAWVESGTDLPSWLPFLVVIVGMVATTYGVSKTKNGITDSIADKLHDAIAEKIDANHFHEQELPATQPISDAVEEKRGEIDAQRLRSIAEGIINNVR